VPKRHPPEVRAAAIAAVSLGEQPSAVAKRFGISQGRLSEWCKVDAPSFSDLPEVSGTAYARTRIRMAELIYDSLIDAFGAIRLQLQAAAREEWLTKQNAGDVASLLDKEFDGAIRLLAGFRPPERPTDDDDSIVDAASRPTDDGV
jgi:hypothetical protein